MAYDDEWNDSDDGAEFDTARLFLAPEYRDLPAEAIESLLESTFPGLDAVAAEDLFRGVGRAFQGVGQTLAQRAPGIVSGAVQGGATGAALGPWGIVGGAAVGGLSGGLRAPAGAAAPQPAAAAPGAAPGSPVAAPPNASVQLMSLLAQPQVAQALLSAAFGTAGRPTLPAGNMAVPTTAVLEAIGTLATRAAEEMGALELAGGAVPAHFADAFGEFAIDPANPDERASHVVAFLGHANESIWADAEGYDDGEYDEDDELADYDEYDELHELDEFDELDEL